MLNKKCFLGGLMELIYLRGHSTTMWTKFCHFLTPPPCVDSFYTLSQRGCREVDRNEYFVEIIPVFSTFSNFFKKKKEKKNYKSYFM